MSGQFHRETPAALGYRMPAEWERQEATWLSWPHNEESFYDFIPRVEEIYCQFIHAVHTGQHVDLLVDDDVMKGRARAMLERHGIDLRAVRFHEIPTVDVWIRDYGPTFVVNDARQSVAMVKWDFNAWGEKYDDLLRDNGVPWKMNEFLGMHVFQPGIVMEGGSIDVNGEGCILTTEQCLLNKNRNPGMKPDQIEQKLKENLHVQKVLWLGEGIVGDDTDGHVDDVARFVGKNVIACAFEDDKNDENHEFLEDNYRRLVAMTDQDGNPFKIVKLPMPGPVLFDDDRMPASYCNFYISNAAVVVPVFNHPNDRKALAIIQDLFPNRVVTGIDCTELVYGFGTLHCGSQQQPVSRYNIR